MLLNSLIGRNLYYLQCSIFLECYVASADCVDCLSVAGCNGDIFC